MTPSSSSGKGVCRCPRRPDTVRSWRSHSTPRRRERLGSFCPAAPCSQGMWVTPGIRPSALLAASPPGPRQSGTSWPEGLSQIRHSPQKLGSSGGWTTLYPSGEVARPAKADMFNRRQPCRGKSQDPVAWMARGRETDLLEPIDEAVFGTVSELSGRNTCERRGSPETDKPRRPSRSLYGEGKREHRTMADAVVSSGGVVATAREQGHVEATGETRLVPAGNCRSKVGRITGSTGKAVEGERESDGHAVAMKRDNARGAKVPCCSATLPPTREAGVR